MPRTIGRVMPAQEADPYVDLFIAIIHRARLDLAAAPRKGRSGKALPSPAERETAAEFLQEVTESARRHLSHGKQGENMTIVQESAPAAVKAKCGEPRRQRLDERYSTLKRLEQELASLELRREQLQAERSAMPVATAMALPSDRVAAMNLSAAQTDILAAIDASLLQKSAELTEAQRAYRELTEETNLIRQGIGRLRDEIEQHNGSRLAKIVELERRLAT